MISGDVQRAYRSDPGSGVRSAGTASSRIEADLEKVAAVLENQPESMNSGAGRQPDGSAASPPPGATSGPAAPGPAAFGPTASSPAASGHAAATQPFPRFPPRSMAATDQAGSAGSPTACRRRLDRVGRPAGGPWHRRVAPDTPGT